MIFATYSSWSFILVAGSWSNFLRIRPIFKYLDPNPGPKIILIRIRDTACQKLSPFKSPAEFVVKYFNGFMEFWLIIWEELLSLSPSQSYIAQFIKEIMLKLDIHFFNRVRLTCFFFLSDKTCPNILLYCILISLSWKNPTFNSCYFMLNFRVFLTLRSNWIYIR